MSNSQRIYNTNGGRGGDGGGWNGGRGGDGGGPNGGRGGDGGGPNGGRGGDGGGWNGGRGGDGSGPNGGGDSSAQIYIERLERNNLQLRQHIQNLEKQIKSMK